MMPPFDPLLLVGGLSIFSVAVYGSLVGGMRQEGGKIRAKTFDLPELLVSLVLGGFFVMLVVESVMNPGTEEEPKITLDQVLPNSLFFVVMFVAITGFLRFRGIDIRIAMGLSRVPLFRAVAIGFGLIIAAFPIVVCASLLMQLVLRQNAQEQELVTLFRQAAQQSNNAGVSHIFIAGAVIAPICEEFLFRGLFYTVFKRYIGALSSALVTSLLFAAFHSSLTAFPSLFVLALCFTIAFEATGSLVVPITMHAIFNAVQLGGLYVATRSVSFPSG
jgi:uncharacterized protein